MTGQSDVDLTDVERNRRLAIQHLDEFINHKDLDAVIRNTSEDFVDHDGPGGKPSDRDEARAMMEQLQEMIPDLRVEIVDSLAEGDRVVQRNIWTGTHARSGRRLEFHGFVLWRAAGGKLVERWATVTPLKELTTDRLEW